MNILVNSGEGFIGSYTLEEPYKAGCTVVLVDNLSNSNPVALERIAELSGVQNIQFYKVEILRP